MKLKQEEIKKALGEKGAEFVEEGMLVGLGSGTTSHHFIESLIKRVEQGLNITAVSSSIKSLTQAQEGGIPVREMDTVTEIDLTIDGADEIDPQNRMIKGGGGAHVREKILASTSRRLIILVDESKLVKQLGKFGLPVEILPFGRMATLEKLERLGYKGALREHEGELVVTDNGNHLYDVHTPKTFVDPEVAHQEIVNTPGVVDTGFFFGLATEVIVGYENGKIEAR